MAEATAGRLPRVTRPRGVWLLVLAGVALLGSGIPAPALAGPSALDRSPGISTATGHAVETACPDGVLVEEDRDEEAKAGLEGLPAADLSAATQSLAFRHGVSGALGPLVDHSCGRLGDGAPGATRAPPPAITGI
jgi:hypothetical protein